MPGTRKLGRTSDSRNAMMLSLIHILAMRNREDDGMITKVVSINRVSKTVKGGRIMHFSVNRLSVFWWKMEYG